jgi:hypothetical protein
MTTLPITIITSNEIADTPMMILVLRLNAILIYPLEVLNLNKRLFYDGILTLVRQPDTTTAPGRVFQKTSVCRPSGLVPFGFEV